MSHPSSHDGAHSADHLPDLSVGSKPLAGAGASAQQAVPDTASSTMGIFFRLHLDLQVAIFDMLDFTDR